MGKQTIYDDTEFYQAFEQDLRAARGLIIIQSPFLTAKRIAGLSEILRHCIARRVRICVFAQKLSEKYKDDTSDFRVESLDQAIRKLTSIGVHITFKKKIHEKIAIIDNEIFWEGSLNILSHFDTRERMTRTIDSNLVEHAMLSYQLGACETCSDRTALKSIFPQQLNAEQLTQYVRETLIKRRRALGLSQETLAKQCGFGQNVVSEFETGKRDPQISTLMQLLIQLKLTCSIAPWWLGPGIGDLLVNAEQSIILTPKTVALDGKMR